MPKIRIKERDLTTNPLVGTTTNDILYVHSGILTPGEAPRFLTELDVSKVTGADKAFLSKVLELGGRVVLADKWQDALDYCSDRNQYDIKFILAKEGQEGIEAVEAEEPEEAKEAKSELAVGLEIVQKRKDCVVIYTKINPNYTTNLTESNLLKQKCTYIGSATASDADQKFYSDEVKTPVGKYVLPFYAKGGVHEDGVTGRPELDAGKAYILAFLDNVAKGRAEWLAIAGATRGAIPGTYKVDGFLKEEEIDNMQLRTYDKDNLIAINPIVNMNPWGTRIWGNRTCLPNTNVTTDGEIATDDGGNVAASPTDQLVASSFANIRIVLCDIKKAIYKAARTYQFEQNTDVLWVNFTSSVNSLLEQMKSSYGIVGYRWKRDSANEQRGELRAILQITPIEAVEDFTVTVELKDSLDNNVQIAE